LLKSYALINAWGFLGLKPVQKSDAVTNFLPVQKKAQKNFKKKNGQDAFSTRWTNL
jgi:hypothetical protein